MFWVCAGKEAVCFVFSLLLVAPTSCPLSPKSPLAVFNHIGPAVCHCSCGTGWLSEPDPEEEEPMGQHPGQGHLLHPRVDAAMGFLSGKNPSHPSCFPSYQ